MYTETPVKSTPQSARSTNPLPYADGYSASTARHPKPSVT